MVKMHYWVFQIWKNLKSQQKRDLRKAIQS